MKTRYFTTISILGLCLLIANGSYACYDPPPPSPPACDTPGVFHLISPDDGATFQSIYNISLCWGQSTYADEYRIFFGTSSPPWGMYGTTTSQCWDVPSGILQPGNTYYWRIRARNKGGDCITSSRLSTEIWSFTIQTSDGTPPTPDPMTWATEPYTTGTDSISMTATTAIDPSGVEYSFECTVGGGHDSGWQDSTTYEDTGLEPSTTYTYKVQARDKSSNQNPTGWSAEASDTTPPAAPTNLAATAVSSSQIGLQWDDNSSNEDGFRIERKVGGGSFEFLVNKSSGDTSHQDTGLVSSTTYTYRVRAYNGDGDSDWSNDASNSPLPEAPSSLTSTAGDGTVSLDWDDNSEGDLDGYNVYRSAFRGGPHDLIVSDHTPSDYTDNSVTNGTTYYYVTSAVDTSDNESAYSNEASAAPRDTNPPAAPTNLSATPGDGTVSLDWDDNDPVADPDLAGYNVYRSTTSGAPYDQIAGGVTSSAYTNNNVTNGTTYYYVVKAVDASLNESGSSNEDSAKPVDPTPPAAPMGLTAVALDGSVNLDWQDNAESDLASYNVYRSETQGGPYDLLSGDLTSSNCTDNTVINDTTYYYVVKAVDASSNESDASNEVSATPHDMTPPAAPTNLSATSGDGTVSLDWDDNSEGDLDGYNVYRSTTSGSSYNQIANVTPSQSDYTDNDAANGTTYYYVVRAVDTSSNESDPSNEDSAAPTDATAPGSPTGLMATAVGGSISLDWNDNGEGDVAGYNVYRKMAPADPYTQIATGVAESEYTDSIVTNGNMYYYVVKAIDTSSNESGASNEDSAALADLVYNKSNGTWYYSIQEAINNAVHGDTIEVSQDTYYENIVLDTKNITLTSTDPYNPSVVAATIIDGSNAGNVVEFSSNDNSKFKGFTVKNSGSANNGIHCSSSNPVISNCVIENNGNGISCNTASPSVKNNIIRSNTSAGIEAGTAAPSIRNNLVYNNSGSGIAIEGTAIIRNCTLTDNNKGFNCTGSAAPTISNCIAWGNTNNSIWTAGADATYSCLQSERTGEGNISTNPLLDGSYNLSSGSPCINRGDPDYVLEEGETDLDGERRIMSARIDMGAYEFGEVIYVDDDAPGATHDGSTWDYAYLYLQDALDIANVEAGDEIWVAVGTYKPDEGNGRIDDDPTETFRLISDVVVYGGFAAGDTSLDERDLASNPTILSGDIDVVDDISEGLPQGNNTYHVVTGADNAVLDGFVITSGYAREGSDNGGGIYCDGVSLTIINCIITRNKAAQNGAGLYAASGASPELINCVFAGNWAVNNGAGLYSTIGCTVSLINCTFNTNKALGDGGGIYCDQSSPTLDNCILWNNEDKDTYVNGPDESAQISVISAAPVINYSCVQGWTANWGGTGNIGGDLVNDDPGFVREGQWDWRQPSGTDFTQGEAFDIDPFEITIRDLLRGFSDVDRSGDNSSTVRDFLIADTLDTSGEVPKPDWDFAPSFKSTCSGEHTFELWFNNDAKWNGPINTNMICENAAKGILRFDSDHFFPVDDAGFGELELCHEIPEKCPAGKEHNYYFTLEYHPESTYIVGQILYFRSSDDLFVAFNDQVLIDKAGYWMPDAVDADGYSETTLVLKQGTIEVWDHDFDLYDVPVRYSDLYVLDPADNIYKRTVSTTLKDGDTYNFHLFWAQRHPVRSILLMDVSYDSVVFFVAGDYHLLANSPCIDAGDNDAVPADITTDIDGLLRFFDDPDTDPDTGNGTAPIVDMGAYEYRILTANDDAYSIYNNKILTVDSADGVLANDIDDNGQTLTAQLVTDVSNGNLTLNADGSFEYTPDYEFYGDDSFTYKAYDGQEYSNDATVTITVYPVLEVEAGDDKVITLPTDTVDMFDAIVTGGDPAATPTTVWSSVSRPLTGTVDFDPDATELNPTVTLGLNADIFTVYDQVEFVLKLEGDDGAVSDEDYVVITVKTGLDPSGQVGPVVEAGEYEPITLPNYNQINLDGTVTDDGLPFGLLPIPTKWTVESFPLGGEVEFADEFSEDTTATFTKDGIYVLKLWASDGQKEGEDTTIITVDGTANQKPDVDAGDDWDITPPTNSPVFTLNSSVTDDGLLQDPPTISWTFTGPIAGMMFDDPSKEQPTVTFTKVGFYVLQLEAFDGQHRVRDQAEVIVNEPPYGSSFVVDAGEDQEVILPDFADLVGDIDPDDINEQQVTKKWSKISGPGGVDFTNDSSLVTSAGFSRPGEYVLRLEGRYGVLTDADEVTITVEPGIRIGGGEEHTLIADDTENKNAWACGYDSPFHGSKGALGIGGDYHYGHYETLPVMVHAGEQDPDYSFDSPTYLANIEAVAAGFTHSLALDTDKNVWAWGGDGDGQLGNGPPPVYVTTPVRVLRGEQTDYSGDGLLERIVDIAAGRSGTHSLAVEFNGHVWAWGSDGSGQLGNGDRSSRYSAIPMQVVGIDLDEDGHWDEAEGYLENIIAISGGETHSIVLEKLDSGDPSCNGRVYTFGNDADGRLGDPGTVSYSLTPVIVHSGEQGLDTYLINIVAISAGWSHSMALEKFVQGDDNYKGRVYTWGNNGPGYGMGGRLGDPDTYPDTDTPVIVHSGEQGLNTHLINIVGISAGEGHSMALDNNGNVWTWGDNKYGQLGDGTAAASNPLPDKVVAPDRDGDGFSDYAGYLGDDIPVIAISAGYWHCLAMDREGNIYSWGEGHGGRLGIGIGSVGDNRNIPQVITELGARVKNLDQDPEDQWYYTIQSAVDNANVASCDRLVAYPGTYYENVTINKNITLTSSDPHNLDVVANTIINGSRGGDTVTFGSGNTSTLSGFTITSGGSGGIYCSGSSPTITNNIISNNEGHGIYCISSSPTITNNIISNNVAHGIYCNNTGTPQIKNNLIFQNSADGICFDNYPGDIATVRNNTIVANEDYGIRLISGTQPQVRNCIIWGNGTTDDDNIFGSFSAISYCGIPVGESYTGGVGNVTVDGDIFVSSDPSYHLRSESSYSNPCINAGESGDYSGEIDIDGDPREMGGIVDIGADEYMPYSVEAGENKVISITESAEMEDATVEYNGLPDPPSTDLTVLWSVINGPLGWDDPPYDPFEDDDILNATATFNKVGNYVLKLEVFEDGNPAGWDIVEVAVQYDVGIVSNPESATLPDATVTLTTTITGDGPSYTLLWAGPDDPWAPEVTFGSTADPLQATATFEEPGIYETAAFVIDDATGGVLGKGTIRIPVNHQQITVNAGDDQTITWSGNNRVYLNGTVSGGVPDATVWEVGDDATELVAFGDASSLQTWVEFDEPGIYEIGLLAKDDQGDVIGGDIVTITVNPPDFSSIIVNAGPDQTIEEPQDFVFLTGSIEDVDEVVTGVQWIAPVDATGAALASFAPSDNQLAVKAEFDSAPAPGDYVFALLAIYNDGSTDYIVGVDTVTVTVSGSGDPYAPAVEVDPGSYEDTDLLASGSRTLSLSGSITDNVGSLVDNTKTEWVCYSSQSYMSFDPSPPVGTLTPDVTFTAAGQYHIGLLAKDSNGNVVGSGVVVINVKSFDGQELNVTASADKYTVTLFVDDPVNLTATVGGGEFHYVEWAGETGKVEFGELTYDGSEDEFKSTATFHQSGTYTLKFSVKRELEDSTVVVVGWDTVEITVNQPQVVVDAKVDLGGGVTEDEYSVVIDGASIDVDLTGEVFGFENSESLVYEWRCSEDVSEIVTFDHQDTSSPDATATITEAGKYQLGLAAIYGSTDIGWDTVWVAVLLSDPIAEAGDDYPTVVPGEELPLDKAHAWCLPNRTLTTIQWSSDPSAGVEFSSTEDINPTVTFANEGIYELTLYVQDSQNDDSSDSVTIVVERPSKYVFAGAPKTAIPYYAISLNDAFAVPSLSTLLYQWSVTSSPDGAEVDFSPSEFVLRPEVVFNTKGDYELTLTVYDGVTLFGRDEVAITVNPNPMQDDAAPVISDFTATIGGSDIDSQTVCGDISITVEAEDAHLHTIYVKLDESTLPIDNLEVIEGSPDSPQKLLLTHVLDTHSIPYSQNSRTLTAYAVDKAGNLTESDPVQFTTDCTIYDFIVTPETITASDQTLDFSADLAPGFPGQWTLEVIGTSYSVSRDDDPMSETGVRPVEDLGLATNGSNNGTYQAKLTADGDEAYVLFNVAMNMSTDDLNAEIDSSLKITYDEFYMPENTRPTITEGFYELWGKAYHPDFPDDVYFKIELSDGKELYKNITPGYLDENGYRNASVGSGAVYGSFGTLDFSSIANGIYQLQLTVKCPGLVKTDQVEVAINCPFKIGNIKFSQEDIVIPVGGYPLRLVRSYDSLRKDRDGDFGHGWTFTLADMDIELNETRQDGGNYTQRCGGEFDRDVTLTLPDGKRVTFVCYMDGSSSSGAGSWTAKYLSPEGVYATLTTKGTEKLIYQSEILYGLGWWWEGYRPNDRTPYLDLSLHDFSGFTLKMKDGTIYNIERKQYPVQEFPDPFGGWEYLYEYQPYGKPYLDSIVMTSGEEIKFILDNVLSTGEEPIVEKVEFYQNGESSPAKSFKIEHDSLGHIRKIYPPSELDQNGELVTGALPYIEYDYDSYGNLTKVSKLVYEDDPQDPGNQRYEDTTYVYDDYVYDPINHYIVDIKDHRGLSPIRYVYDNSGRMIGVYDAKGNYIEIDHDLANNTEVVTDRLDNITVYYYNERGNVERIENHLGYNTLYEYTDLDNLDKPTKARVQLDEAADPLDYPPVEAHWSTTEYVYDSKGRPTIVTDPVYNVTTNAYDDLGSLTLTAQWRLTDPADPDPVFPADYTEVSTTTNTYENNLLKTTEITKDSQRYDMMVNIYDNKNRITHAIKINLPRISDFNPLYTLSDIGSLENQADHSITSYTYDEGSSNSPDQPYRITEPSGAKRYFEYDENGNQVLSWYKWVDPAGQDPDRYVITVNDYDGQGRVIQTRRLVDNEIPYNELDLISEVILSSTTYNSIGKPDMVEGEHLPGEEGKLTVYEYDEVGNLVETKTYENYTAYAAHPVSNRLTVTQTLYDAEGRVLVTVGPYAPASADEPVGTENIYDALGRVVETRRWADVEITMEDVTNSNNEVVGRCSTGWTTEGAAATAGNELSYTKTIYDIAGRIKHSVTLEEVWDQAYVTKEQPTTYNYDDAGKQEEVIDPLGHQITYITGDIYTIAWANTSWDVSLNLGHRTKTEYIGTRRDYIIDARGFEPEAVQDHYKTSFAYDALGRLTKTTHPETVVDEGGATPVITYSHVEYDGLGRKAWQSETTIESNPANAIGREFYYDTAGRLTAVELPVVDDPEDDPDLGETVHPRYDYFYDDYGNQVGRLEPKGRLTVFKYDQLNRQTAQYMPFEFTDPTPGTPVTVDDVYTALGNASPAPDSQTRQYNDLGQLERTKDFKGQYTLYEYVTSGCGCGETGKLKAKQFYDGDPDTTGVLRSHFEFTYDALGRKVTKTITEYDTGGSTVTYIRCYEKVYNDDGQIDSVNIYPTFADYQGGTNLLDSVGYGYDDITGRKALVRTPDDDLSYQTQVGYTYDTLGRLKTVEVDKRNGEEPAAEDSTYDYNPIGSRSSLTYANGNFAEYQYDALNRLNVLTNWQTDAKNTELSKFTHKLYADGMRKEVAEKVDENRTVTYTYDNLNRLTNEQGTSSSGSYSIEYTYDLVGNRTQRVVTANGNVLTTDYTYDSKTDRLTTEEHAGPTTCMYIGDRPYYAYAKPGGGFYYLDTDGNKLGSFGAFIRGLPSSFSQWLFRALMLLIPIAMFAPVAAKVLSRIRKPKPGHCCIRLRLYHRCASVLLAYIMLISPIGIQELAQADIQYSDLCTLDWANGGETIYYSYDNNGSMTQKITALTSEQYPETTYLEKNVYIYNLQNRLERLETYDDTQTLVNVVEYKYNPDGIKIQKTLNPDGTPEVTDYLIDPYNHTGYAQVFVEDDGTNKTSYIIGDDVLAQATNTNDPEYLLYDGHGSTRQLVASDGTTINDSYSYDSYGVMLGGNPTSASPAGTSMLYAGEQFDTSLQMYYNRARYYDQSTGRFNRMDPYAGSNQDPQSLHKYNYAHNNPINGADPSGYSYSFVINVSVGVTIGLLLVALIWTGVNRISYHRQARKYQRYDLKQNCNDYNEEKCAAVDVDNYDDGTKSKCRKEADEIAKYYKDWLQDYWSSAPWYTPCDQYQYKIWSAMTDKKFEFFYFKHGTDTIGTGEELDHMNFVGIFHVCNRKKKTRADGAYTLLPGDVSDATLFPWHVGAPYKIYNRGLGNPYLQPGRGSELGWY